MAHSTIPAVKSALVDQLRARPNLAGLQVEYASPGDDAEMESIFLGAATAEHEITRSNGGTRKRRDETYDVDLVVQVLVRGGTAEEADARAMELVGEVEDMLADDVRLGGAVAGLQHVTFKSVDLRPYLFDRGRAAVATVTLGVYALLS